MIKQILFGKANGWSVFGIALFLLPFLILCSPSVFGQNDKAQDKKLYNQAWDLRRQGYKYYSKEPLKAAKLFEEANRIYPGNPDPNLSTVEARNMLPGLLVEQGDIRGANKSIEEEIKRLIEMKEVFITNGVSSKYIPVEDWITRYYLLRASLNSNYGDMQQALNDYITVRNRISFDANQFLNLSILANEAGDFKTSEECIEALKKFYLGKSKLYLSMQLQPVYAEAALNMAKGEFNKVLPLAERLVTEDKGLNTTWKGYGYLLKAEAFAYLGNVDSARLNFNNAIKRSDFYAGANNAIYIKGLILMLQKDYQDAIASFTAELNSKKIPSATAYFPDIKTKYRYYTKRAEAYLAQGNYVKTKADYEAALLYNANFEPAINGLIKLESRLITDRKADKAGPQIVVTEPSLSRGLKITNSGSEVMVKGKALDPSGLKSVSINDNLVYSQEDGVFWGSITLKDGTNKIAVKAIDMAGNITDQIFEIEKQTAPVTASDIVPVQAKEAKNYALIIAAQNYDDSSIPSLENPVSDAIKLKLILKNNYSFAEDNVYTLFNPTVIDFKQKFVEINEFLQPEDNLIIFYAGHGIWVEKEKKGYWLLTDAKRNDANTWLSNKLVLEMIAKIPSRHTLLITDACFSGSVFKTRSIGADAPIAIREMSEKISRVAITSGNDTEVPDESVFMKYLVKALSENKEKYLTAQKMFITQIIEAVMTESKTEPRYGTLELAGHVGGDFIFSKK